MPSSRGASDASLFPARLKRSALSYATVVAEPLFSQHGAESSNETAGETGVEKRLDPYHACAGSGPLREWCGDGKIDGDIDEDEEECMGHVVWIRAQVR